MARILCIMGESGSGKTTSLRNLDPSSTYIINCDKKGLSWRGWKKQYNRENKNYYVTDYPEKVLALLKNVEQANHIKVIIVDTLNGIMLAEELRRIREKGYDKWTDLATNITSIISYAQDMRDDLTVIFTAHTQTDRDDCGYVFTHIKTNGRKLEKDTLERHFPMVLHSKRADGKYIFETSSDFSTAKAPMDLFDKFIIDNDIQAVVDAWEKYENE